MKKNKLKAAIVADNADGLYIAVYSSRKCIFLGDYKWQEEQAGKDFAALRNGEITEDNVAEWEEGRMSEILDELAETMPRKTRAQLRDYILHGDNEEPALYEGGDIFWSDEKDFATSACNITRALIAAGLIDDN